VDRDERLAAGAPWCIAVLVAAAGFLAYANTFDGEWVWDDASSVLLHEHVKAPAVVLAEGRGSLLEAFGQLFLEDQHAFGRGQGNFYRPLLSVTFAIDYLLSAPPESVGKPGGDTGLGVFWFHLHSIAWHVLAALGLLALLRRLDAPLVVQAVVPLLWVLHPLHTEAVAYISGRADMMSGAFVFWAAWCALAARNSITGWSYTLASLALFALGLCSKEATLIYPVVLLVCLLLQPKSDDTPGIGIRLLPLAGALALLVGYLYLRTTVLSFAEAGESTAAPLGQRLIETLQSFGYYIGLLFWPTGLHMERTLDGAGVLATVFGAAALALLVTLAALAYRRQAPRITLGIAWFLITWLPISGIFPLNAPLAEHWMYVPMAGFWWALAELALAAARPVRFPALLPAGAAALAILFLVLTIQRNEDWHSSERLFIATLRENPDTARVHYNLAVTYGDIENETAAAKRHYEEVLRVRGDLLSDDRLESHLSLAALHLNDAQAAEANQHLRVLQTNATGGDLAAEIWLTQVRTQTALGDLGGVLQLLQHPLLQQTPQLANIAARFIEGAPALESPNYPGLLPH